MKRFFQALVFFIFAYNFLGNVSAADRKIEFKGIQSLTCGSEKFEARSLDFFSVYEIVNARGFKVSNLVTPWVGSITEWSCIKIQKKYYLFLRGRFTIPATQDVSHTAIYIIHTRLNNLILNGSLYEYTKLFQNDDFLNARKRYRAIDNAYRSATFRQFDFDLL